MLSASIEELPGKQRPLVAPFSNLVVNLNVATKAHRDVMDKEFCLVLAIGDFDEGDLCLHEPGLVLGLRNGDLAVFRSANITHFNRHFIGYRASFALSTDKMMDGWTGGRRNGWGTNVFMH